MRRRNEVTEPRCLMIDRKLMAVILELSDDDAGKLCKAVFLYRLTQQTANSIDPMLRPLYNLWVRDADEDRDNYFRECARNSYNGSIKQWRRNGVAIPDPDAYINNKVAEYKSILANSSKYIEICNDDYTPVDDYGFDEYGD